MEIDHPYARVYDAEWQRREQLNSAVTTPLGLLVVLGTGLMVLLQRYEGEVLWLRWVFWPAFSVAGGGLVLASYMLARSFHGHRYLRMPLPSQLQVYREALERYHAATGTPDRAEPDFRDYVRDRYVETTDQNAVNNIRRGEYLYRANRVLLVTLLAAGIAALPFAIELRTVPAKPQRIEIVNRGWTSMSAAESSASGPEIRPDEGAHPSVLPPRPKPPASIEVSTRIKLPPTHERFRSKE